jgi:hypothetical protein
MLDWAGNCCCSFDGVAYRVAAITFSIVALISRGAAWVLAWHRFLEVSLGIAVTLIALLVSQPKKKLANQS